VLDERTPSFPSRLPIRTPRISRSTMNAVMPR
jgi:hypothetical protein